MAIINCPECNKEVSDKAQSCPNCGFGVAEFIERQKKIEQIQNESEREAYKYVIHKKQEEKEQVEKEKKAEEERKDNVYKQAINKFEIDSSQEVEEAEKLFLSIDGWKDANIYYQKCKDRILALREVEKIKVAKERKQKRKRNGIIIILVALLAITSVFYLGVVVPKQNFEKGMKALSDGDNKLAYEYLIKSHVQSDEIYKIAEAYYQKGDYYKAFMLSHMFKFDFIEDLPMEKVITGLLDDQYPLYRLEILMNSGLYESLPRMYADRVEQMINSFETLSGAYKRTSSVLEEYYYIDKYYICSSLGDSFYQSTQAYVYDFNTNRWYTSVDQSTYLEYSNGCIVVNGDSKYEKIPIVELPDMFFEYMKKENKYEY